MSKSIKYYFPTLFYSLLLVAIWLLSWIMGLLALFSSEIQRGDSLLSAAGVRWALRTATHSLESAPWGSAVLCVVTLGLCHGSGLLETLFLFFNRKPLSYNRRWAAAMSLLLFLLSILFILFSTIAPWSALAGVTADFSSSSVVIGWLPLVFIVVLVVTAMHGAVSGYYRSLSDVFDGVRCTFTLFLPAFIAMIPASGILPSFSYIGITFSSGYSELFLYVLPFLFILPSYFKEVLYRASL